MGKNFKIKIRYEGDHEKASHKWYVPRSLLFLKLLLILFLIFIFVKSYQ